jgi:methylated-DNA-[protein]-cysteine S-methyltransferase
MNQSIHTFHDSPLGRLLLESKDGCLTGLWLPHGGHVVSHPPAGRRVDGAFDLVRRQLDDYFAGRRRTFAVEMRGAGTVFQQSVWAALREIPYGETWSYGQLAARLGRPAASRAVGAANGQNPLSILVPCHRVVGANGSLTGYGGGLPAKRWLLELERSGIPPLFPAE